MKTIYGYWRCSTDQQDQERQIRSLSDAGCERIVGDFITGTSNYGDRKELSKLLYFDLLVSELNEVEPDGLLRFIKKLDIRKEERFKNYLMIKKGEHDIYNKLLIEDLICDIKSYKLDNKDQKKSGEEIQKIVENAHLEIVNKHLDMCKKKFKN